MPLTWNIINPIPTNVRSITPGNQFHGPIFRNGRYWVVVEQGQPAVPPGGWSVQVYSSATGVAGTWTHEDAANEPTNYDVNGGVYYGGGSPIHVIWKDYIAAGNRPLTAVTFDIDTRHWVVPGNPGPSTASNLFPYVVVRSTGDLVVFYEDSAVPQVNYAILSGGVWGAPVKVNTLVPPGVVTSCGILLDALDLIHFFYYNATDKYYHRSLDNTNVLGAEQALYAHNGVNFNLGQPCLWNGKIEVPYAKKVGADYFPAVYEGTAAGDANPVWANRDVSAVTKVMAPFQPDNASMFSVNDTAGGNLYVFWVTPIEAFGSGLMNTIYYNKDAGAGFLGDTAYFTDASQNPADQDWFHNPSVFFTAADTFSVIVDRINQDAGTNLSVTGFIVSGAAPALDTMFGIPIYLGPFNKVWKLGIAPLLDPIWATPGIVAGTTTSLTLPTAFVDTSEAPFDNHTKVPEDMVLTAPLHINFYDTEWRITSGNKDNIVIQRNGGGVDPGVATLVCRLNMQLPHSFPVGGIGENI